MKVLCLIRQLAMNYSRGKQCIHRLAGRLVTGGDDFNRRLAA
jgi:hypothetical protein